MANKKIIKIPICMAVSTYTVRDTIQQGDVDAYRLEITLTDIDQIDGMAELRFVYPDGQYADREADITGNVIRYDMEPADYSQLGELKCYVRVLDNNLFTPVLLVFTGIRPLVGNVEFEGEIQPYPEWAKQLKRDIEEGTAVGPQGPQGEIGPQGEQGIQGPQGDQGPQGETGPEGPQGPKGDTGDTGPQGPKGDKGDTGDTGPKGEQGPKGDTGDQGPQGEQGIQGPQGERGPQGETGPKGDPGTPGSDANITAQSIAAALTYTPAKESDMQTVMDILDGLGLAEGESF